ncbi:unnamed protein product, partial [Ixodes pacificus]
MELTNVVSLLAGNRVAADFPVLDGRKPGAHAHLVDELLLVEGAGQVPFVAQHQHGDPRQLGLIQQVVQLVARRLHLVLVVGIHHGLTNSHNGVDTSAIAFPHAAKPGLPSNVPDLQKEGTYLDSNISLGHLSHVEADRRYHTKATPQRANTHGDDVHEGGLPRILESHQRELHLLFPEEALEPVKDPVDERQHLVGREC